MTDQWVVVLHTGSGPTATCVYGPIGDEDTARSFAEFMKVEVDPATVHRLMSPTAELLANWRNRQLDNTVRPEFWPPQPGQIWQDRNKDRWICVGTPSQTPYLTCLAHMADDSAEEIWRVHGPMSFVTSTDPTEVECPF